MMPDANLLYKGQEPGTCCFLLFRELLTTKVVSFQYSLNRRF